MSQSGEIVQNEINIRELLEAVWKGKVIIAVVTAIAVFVSAIASIFFIPKQYEAKSSLMISPMSIKASALQTTVSIVDYLANMPVLTKANYIQDVKSVQVLESTIKNLELKDASGNYISVNSLSNAVTVTDVASTNIIDITVNYRDSEKAAQIANTMSQLFADYVAQNTKLQIQAASDSIAEQLSTGEKDLIEKTNALDDYRSNNKNIDVLREDAKNLIDQIADYNTDYEDIVTQISSDTAALQILESASQSTDIIPSQNYNLSIDLNSNPETVGQNQVNIQPDSLSSSLLAINVNTLQTRLVCNQAKKATLETRIPELELSLSETQTILTKEEYKYNTVNNDMIAAQLTYDAYEQRNKEVTAYNESDIGKSIVTVSAEATTGQIVSPNKKTNVIVSGMFGFCVSIFFVLFRNYWRRTKVSPTK